MTLLADDQPGRLGHSKHGSAFDTGMRAKPWRMAGIGNAPFPIACKSKEVQEWYDQGNALMHSFWFEEAERSFRWWNRTKLLTRFAKAGREGREFPGVWPGERSIPLRPGEPGRSRLIVANRNSFRHNA